MSSRRPEHQAPAEVFYNESEAGKYANNTRIMKIQSEMSERALELLNLSSERSCFVLDIGCGSGISGECVEEAGHHWVGVDISADMLSVASEKMEDVEEESNGDLILGDAGQGLHFRPGSFDGAISISALQWLCNSDRKLHSPYKRLAKFFSSLYSTLCNSARAVFQFYPENHQQVQMLTEQSTRAGFTGGLVIDFPNSTKAKKYYLVLMTANVSGGYVPPKALGVDEHDRSSFKRDKIEFEGSRNKRTVGVENCRQLVRKMKDRRRRKGLHTRPDTKYTGRKRTSKF